jgi:hypothetical protein
MSSEALRELLAGFQSEARIAGLPEGHEGQLHAGLVAAIMRMAFVLFAEEEGLLPLSLGRDAGALTRIHAELAQEARGGPARGERHGAWARVTAVFRRIHEGAAGGLFDPGTYPFLEGPIPDGVVLRVLDRLVARASGDPTPTPPQGGARNGGEHRAERSRGSLARGGEDHGRDVERIGTVYEGLVGEERRRLGAHYTSRAITRAMVARTLGPLLRDDTSPDEILALAICDPAMGAGAFLVEACRQLAEALVRAWERTGTTPALPPGRDPILDARALVARRCLHGVDRSALAVELARLSLWLVASARDQPFSFVDHALRHGDSLVGLSREQIAGVAVDVGRGTAPSAARAMIAARLEEAGPERQRLAGDLVLAAFFGAQDRRAQARAMAAAPDLVARVLRGDPAPEADRLLAALRGRHLPFHWELEFPEVFAAGRGGFDAIIGNPPWVSYAGRAAQPLDDDLRDLYLSTSPAFHGYRNLQGVFVHRAASMLRPGGRLGLVLPTSMSDLGGYEPSRRAHDELCACDEELPDFGDRAFDGVFQPSMGLLSTRRPSPVSLERAGEWPLQRRDLDGETIAILDRLRALPPLPAGLFGERGFQTMGDDVSQLHALAGPEGRFTTGVRVGGDIEPFLRRPPGLRCDPGAFAARFRPEREWRGVKLLIRQTARYPMAALSDGQAFRNSILAGFAGEEHGEHLLLAYLNSSPIRWFHYMRHRDARQGMPQLKIGHLRALPAPPRGAPALAALERIGRELGARNTGISAAEQEIIDGLAADALDLDGAARARIAAWASTVRG